MGMALHHFDIGVVSVFVIFVICLRISPWVEQSYASPAIIRFVVRLLARGGGTTRSQGRQGAGMASDRGLSVGWEAK